MVRPAISSPRKCKIGKSVALIEKSRPRGGCGQWIGDMGMYLQLYAKQS